MVSPAGYDITKNRLYRDLVQAEEVFTAVARGDLTSVLCSGPPGIGKTYLAMRALRKSKVRVRECSPKAPQFCDILHKYRRRAVLLFDDSDHFFSSEGLMNLLKKAMDSKLIRIIPDDRIKGHGQFHFESGVVFLTNKNINNPNDFDREMRPHIEALKSRINPKIILSFDRLDCFNYSCWLATDGAHILRDLGLSIAASNEVLRWFADNLWRLDEVSPRKILNVGKLRRTFASWRELAEQGLPAEPAAEYKHARAPEAWEITAPVKPSELKVAANEAAAEKPVKKAVRKKAAAKPKARKKAKAK